jgi:hypothetical protein
MRVLTVQSFLAFVFAVGCDRPTIEERDVRCPDAGPCPSGFTCGYGDYCYLEDQPPADFAGAYTLTMTQGENRCMVDIEGWTEGAVTSDIPLTISQNGRSFDLTVDGTAGLFLEFFLGSKTIVGTVDGITTTLSYTGTRLQTLETPPCEYYLNASGGAFLVDDLLEGHLDLLAAGATCDELMDCRLPILLSGVRQ